ncbi:MAG: Gfo/Idh/MocA family oxidoreductase [Planctomycetaceae bacterium]|nr:Gfo/Idh/MocA family oxidoreductase [Planctomycetaceae bacterium]
MAQVQSRRQFLVSSAIAVNAATFAATASAKSYARILGSNEKLNVGVIGVGGRGGANLDAVSSENVIALCDVDADRLGAAAARHTSARTYVDYRQLLEQSDLEAVVVATPDHHHAPATVRALRRGLHVYCEKPLTHTVEEARLIAKLSAEKKVATQMGTQNHEHPGYLRLVELLRAGAIGSVKEVHVITDRPGKWWPQGVARPTETPAVPANLSWDLWLGPAAERAYHPAYVPFKWRGWWDFGCGAIGDMAIHLADPAFWGLNLGGKVKVTSAGPEPNAWSAPTWMETRMEFGQRGDLGPVTFVWYEGEAKPKPEIAADLPMNGSLFIGDKGRIAIQHDGFPKLLPEDKFKDYVAPAPSLPESPGHHRQWIEACKTGSRTGSPFSYAAPFTEIILLGNVAYRSGVTIEYDPATGKIANSPAAEKYLSKEYRKGWDIRS